MEMQKCITSEDVVIDTDNNSLESCGIEEKVMHYTFEQILMLRKTLHDVVREENLEVPAQFRQDVITDKKGFFIIFAVISLAAFLIYSHYSLQIHHPDVIDNLFGNTKNISDYYNQVPFQDFWYSLGTSWWKFLLNITTTIFLCAVVFFLILFYPAAVLRTAVVCAVMFFAVLIPASWALVAMGANITTIICIIAVTIPTFFVVCFAARYCYSYIHQTANLYKEAEKIILAMPNLLQLTFMSMFLQLVIVSLFVTVATLSIAASTSYLLYVDIVATNWVLYFVEGFVCMVTAGSVNAWYNLGYDQPSTSPISKSLIRVVKYHIGTIAFGSILHPSVAFVRNAVKILSCNFSDHLPSLNSWNPESRLTLFLKKIAYVGSAIHGKPYTQAGKESFIAFYTRTPLFLTLNEGAELASLAIKLNLLVYPTAISCLLFWENGNIFWLATMQCLCANVIIVAAFLHTIETVAHTILTNFCEDELLRKYFKVTFTKKTAILIT